MDINEIRGLIIGFVLISLIAASGAIALDAFKSDVKTGKVTSVINETRTTGTDLTQSGTDLFIGANACRNASMIAVVLDLHCNVSTTGTVTLNSVNFTDGDAFVDYSHYTPSYMLNISNNGLRGIDNTTSYFGTAGTIAGVALLLGIVIGAFYFVTRREQL